MRACAHHHHRWITGVVGVATVLAVSGLAATAQPPKDQPPPAEPPKEAPVVVIERVGLSEFVVDERDAALARAIGMLPERLRELPAEVDGLEMPGPVVEAVLAALSRPARLALTYNANDQTRGAFGLGLVASVLTTGREQANEIQGTVAGMIAAHGAPFESKPSAEYQGMTEMFLPFGQLRYGPREAGGSTRWEVHFGSITDPELAFRALPADAAGGPVGKGFKPVIRGRIDPAPLAPLVNMGRMMAAGGPGVEAIDSAVEAGLVGTDAVKYSFQFGYTDDASISTWTIEGARKYAEKWGMGTEPLSDAHLNAVPADATTAAVTTFDPTVLTNMLASLKQQEPEVGEHLAQFAAHTGVDLEKDVIGALGGVVGVYMAEASGGAGLTSAVLFVSLKDAAKLREASGKLASMANAMLAQHHDVKGHVRVREWQESGVMLSTLSFPGIPIPLELTYSITDGLLVAALTPQAALVGVRQATGKGDKGLGSNAAFRAGLAQGKRPTGVSFIDTARVMGDGYPFVSMFGSALANAVRSPLGADREPGLIVPPLSDLKQGVKPRVGCTYWEGDNLVHVTRGNRSLLVESCGVMGAAAPVLPVVGAMIGGMAGAAERAREMRAMQRWGEGFEEGMREAGEE